VTPANLDVLTHADRTARLRGGGTCTAAQLAAAVGPDTARFALLRARPGRTPVLDLAALRTATDANPAHRVRFTHARLCALSRHAAALGIESAATPATGDPELVELLAAYPAAVDRGEPYPLARYLEALAAACTRLESGALPVGDRDVTDDQRANLALLDAARRLLADGLRRLDVTAPERM
jgi:arginyl-tRNA synthetase